MASSGAVRTLQQLLDALGNGQPPRGGDLMDLTQTLGNKVLALAVNAVSFSIASGASNVCAITITPTNADGTALTGVRELEMWLSDSTTGVGLTATASQTTSAGASGGTILTALTAKKHLLAQTTVGGTFSLEVTDAVKNPFVIAVKAGAGGVASVSRALVTGDYG